MLQNKSFKIMEEVGAAAKEVYAGYVKRGLGQKESMFKGVGTEYILFAMEEPKLFQLLFMAEQTKRLALDGVLSLIEVFMQLYHW